MNDNSIKIILFLFSVFSTPYALVAPYLISATALSDSSISVQWRNNDVATSGYLVLRKEAGESTFIFVDSVKNASLNSFIDTSLKDTTAYTYKIIAYNAESVSDTSNAAQAITFRHILVPIFSQPGFWISWNNWDNSNSIKLSISDYSNCEIGFKIFRADGTGNYAAIKQITSINPKEMSSISWEDSAVVTNQWYKYKILEYKSDDSLYSNEDSVYTFRAPIPQYLVKFFKKSEFPINYPVWSAQAGDSIILKESPSPEDSFTAINIKDPSAPTFAGYIDSAHLLIYPVSTLIPVFLKFNIVNSYLDTRALLWGNRLLLQKDSVLTMFDLRNNDFYLIDTLSNAYGHLIPAFQERYVLVEKRLIAYSTGSVLLVRLEDTALIPLGNIPWAGSSAAYSSSQCYTNGLFDNRFYTSWTLIAPRAGGTFYKTYVYDMDFSPPKTTILDKCIPSAANTGLYISSSVNLCTNPSLPGTMLIGIDPRNPQSWNIVSRNNMLYHDSTHLLSSLRNIILDTLHKNVFLLYERSLVIVGYEFVYDFISKTKPAMFQKHQKGGFAVHRNLLSGRTITISFSPAQNTANINIFTLNGRLIKKMTNVHSNTRLNISDLKAGTIYLLRVEIAGSQYTTKIFLKD